VLLKLTLWAVSKKEHYLAIQLVHAEGNFRNAPKEEAEAVKGKENWRRQTPF